MKQRAAEIKKTNDVISTYCPATVGVPNGKVDIEILVGSPTKATYSVECDIGFKLKGDKKVTCNNGKYKAIGICASASKTQPITSGAIAIVLVAGLLRHLMSSYF